MKQNKWQRRDRAQWKRKHGMRVTGKGFVHIQNSIAKRGGN